MRHDVAIVGGGPVGLATALELQARGLSVVVLERRSGAVDKACGEGLMPAGRVALDRLGVTRWLSPADCHAFTAIRYVQEDGRAVQTALPAPGGLGVRRTALRRAFVCAARAREIDLRDECAVRALEVGTDGVVLATDAGDVTARFLVGADGLHSPTRRALELDGAAASTRRFGLRQHFALAPWAPRVEVHWGDGVEAYVTPAGAERVGVAFLWEAGAIGEPVDVAALLTRFPVLGERLAGARPDSPPLGAGPLRQEVRARTARRAALVGDAAGSVDAITGEGLSLGFEQARALAAVLPGALASGASVASLARYERESAIAFRRYARLADGLLWMARRPTLRRFVLGRLIATPRLFGVLLSSLIPPASEVEPLSER
ncbi:MAG: FAD-dependent monooxygenase [Proteobacteria bacterium]|nr:FAD-dependent monooxygenase [Pseudomonadota bacterium]